MAEGRFLVHSNNRRIVEARNYYRINVFIARLYRQTFNIQTAMLLTEKFTR